MDSRSYTGPTAAPAPLWSTSGATTSSSCSPPSAACSPRARAAMPGAKTPSSLVIRMRIEEIPFKWVGRGASRREGEERPRRALIAYHTGRRRHPLGPSRRPSPPMTLRPRTLPEDQRPAETTSATGDQWVIGHGHPRAVITEIGATLRAFTVDDRPVIDGFGPEQWSQGGRGQVLAPWPNRLGDGRYTFDGIEAQAPLNEVSRANAIHGLVRWLPWHMVGRAQNQVSLSCELHPAPGYPFALRLTIEYRLGRDGLTEVVDADNTGPSDLPFGLGFHPYLTAGTPTVDQVRLKVPAELRLLTDERGLPTSVAPVAGTEFDFTDGRLIGVTRLDTAYTGPVSYTHLR